MKKICIIVEMSGLLFLGCSILQACSVEEGILETKKFSIDAEATFVEDRDMRELEDAQVSSKQYLAGLKYGLMDRITLIGKLGAADLETHLSEGETTFFDMGLAYGAGIKALLYENPEKNYRFHLEGNYFAFEPASGGETTGVRVDTVSSGGEVEIDWQEWQISLDIAKDLGNTIAYAGIKYSDLECAQTRKLANSNVQTSFKAKDNFGFFCGVNVPFGEKFAGNFEVRFLDETAFTAKLRFVW